MGAWAIFSYYILYGLIAHHSRHVKSVDRYIIGWKKEGALDLLVPCIISPMLIKTNWFR